MAQLIQDLTILLLVSLPITVLFHRFKLPTVVGFLVTGMLIGPHGLGLIGDLESVEHLAEIGVILLLFIIGLEFSLSQMLKQLGRIVGTGGLQLGLTAVVCFFLFSAMSFPVNQSVALGLLIALSSTAILLNMLNERVELDTLHGRIAVGVLLFQDVCVVPFMLVVPLLAKIETISGWSFLWAFLKAVGAVGGVFFLSRLLVPRALGRIVQVGKREHLTLFVIFIILGTGWVSHQIGLTLAMGAFIAGLILSETEYNHQIILDILPLKEYFVSVFFTSVGMLMQVEVFLEQPGFLLMLAAVVIAVKAVMAFVAALLAGTAPRIAFIVGIRLAQVGEFSLILAAVALETGVFDSRLYQQFLIVSILSMIVAPFLIQVSSSLSLRLFKGGLAADSGTQSKATQVSDHVIVVGYDTVGQNLSKVLREVQIPFTVVDLDGQQIKRALVEQCHGFYGDATQRSTLLRAGIRQAKMLVVSIQELKALEQVVRLARQLNPNLYILVKTRLASEVESLTQAGADLVIPAEFETSIEIFSRVLREFGMPHNVIEQQVELMRLEGYRMLRGLSLNMDSLANFSTYLTASLSRSFLVLEGSWANGKTLRQIELKTKTGATLIAVVRNQEAQPNPIADFTIEVRDVLILFGSHAQLDQAHRLLQDGPSTKSESRARVN
ncbi:Kef-type potassium transporter [Nitrospina gracilis 3/211]|uniref:Kef-type potassium transporter n=1 Tax=Nitrospina gracilis (strain 3/211) TaxID=1266370 RepID=M1YXN5_NITG3|nr:MULTISPECIES: cation:proton antiporter [Nitrospina]MCF8723020.1 CPA2 family monovalent cation:H+ antiporter-2 [Nitrospina sp. Nb-3]CCQ90048.1 Kef-type potassium transporter [Nitrospina gracilis 3/211]